jgi:NADH-quinone oxidoreductase subunit N
VRWLFFVLSLCRQLESNQLKNTAVFFGFLTFIATLIGVDDKATIFFNSYEIDLYSQLFKLMIGFGLAIVLVFSQNLKDIDSSVRPEYYMFLFLSCLGLMMLVSAVELITIFVALELSSFALYLLVPMRSDQQGLRVQMEAGIKYILFGGYGHGIHAVRHELYFRPDRQHLSG